MQPESKIVAAFDRHQEIETLRPRREAVLAILNRHNGRHFTVTAHRRTEGSNGESPGSLRTFTFERWGFQLKGWGRDAALGYGLVAVLDEGADAPRMLNLDGVETIDVDGYRYRRDQDRFIEQAPQDETREAARRRLAILQAKINEVWPE